VRAHRFFRHFLETDTFDLCGRAGEILLDEFAVEADGFKDLRTAIRLVGGDAHLGHHLHQTLVDGLDETLLGILRIQTSGQFQCGDGVEREPRAHGFGTVASQQGEVMYLACGTGIYHQTGAGAQTGSHQMVVHGCGRQQGRDRHACRAHRAVGQDQNVVTFGYGLLGRLAQGGNGFLAACRAVLHRIGDVQHLRLVGTLGELVDVVQLGDVFLRQHRLMHF